DVTGPRVLRTGAAGQHRYLLNTRAWPLSAAARTLRSSRGGGSASAVWESNLVARRRGHQVGRTAGQRHGCRSGRAVATGVIRVGPACRAGVSPPTAVLSTWRTRCVSHTGPGDHSAAHELDRPPRGAPALLVRGGGGQLVENVEHLLAPAHEVAGAQLGALEHGVERGAACPLVHGGDDPGVDGLVARHAVLVLQLGELVRDAHSRPHGVPERSSAGPARGA